MVEESREEYLSGISGYCDIFDEEEGQQLQLSLKRRILLAV